MLLRVINQLSLSYLRRPTLHRSKNIVSLYELELTVLYLQTFVHLYHARQTDSSSSHVTGHAKICESSCQPIGYTLSNPQTFPTIEIIPTPRNSHIPLENHGNRPKKKRWASLLGTTHLRSPPLCHSTSWRWRPGWWADTQQTSLARSWQVAFCWESWWKHVMFTTHDWEWLKIPPIYIYKNGDDWGLLIIAVLTLDLRNLHL